MLIGGERMGLFSNTKINIIEKVPDDIVIAVTGAKAALKCELISMEENEKYMTYPMVMTLNGIPLMEMHPSYCPTCYGLLATGYKDIMDIAAEFCYSSPYRGFTALKAVFSNQSFIYLMSCMVLLPWCFLIRFYAFYYEGFYFIGNDIILPAAAGLSFPRNCLPFPVFLYCIA